MVDIKQLIRDRFKEVEKIELVRDSIWEKDLVETTYPKPITRQHLIFENFGSSIEESYFWLKDMFNDVGYPVTEKIIDTYNASEQSAMFGSAQQRLGIQQDRVSSYLATIGKMTKEMFQIVRDIKLLEERKKWYELAEKKDDGAEKTLKGIWIDFVDNGPSGIKASSVYGMASQLGYHALPDLFFNAPPALRQEDVSKYVETLGKDGFNTKVTSALVRKLEMYVAWRDSTQKEIAAKLKFTLQYLRQHYNSVMLYVDWVKPYLRNVKRLGMDAETQLSTDIVGAFEGAVVEIEILAIKPGKEDPDEPRPCILASFRHRTRPIMNTGQDYQRGPTHIGRIEFTLRGYAWTDRDIQMYRDIRRQEDFEMLRSIDQSIEESMDYLGDSLKEYLKQAGESFGTDARVDQLAKKLVESGAVTDSEKAKEKAKELIGKNFDIKHDQESLAKALFDARAASTMEYARKEAEKMLKKDEKKPQQGMLKDITRSFMELGGFMPGKKQQHDRGTKQKEIEDKKKKMAKGIVKGVALSMMIYKKAHRLFTP